MIEKNITETLKQLENIDAFSDVTLACDDGQQFNAHKIIVRNILQQVKTF